jgi:hypothetical protein
MSSSPVPVATLLPGFSTSRIQTQGVELDGRVRQHQAHAGDHGERRLRRLLRLRLESAHEDHVLGGLDRAALGGLLDVDVSLRHRHLAGDPGRGALVFDVQVG